MKDGDGPVAGTQQVHRVIVLGATGRLGGLLLHPACADAWGGVAAIPVARRADVPGMLHWAPGMPTGSLPKADAVIALWGLTAGDDAALAINAALAAPAQALGRAVGARLVIHASSAAVYGAGADQFTETAPLDQSTIPYGDAKRAMEQALAKIVADALPCDPSAVWLRIANVAGADALFRRMADGGPITLDQFADHGGPERSYVAPQDLVRVCLALARASTPPSGPMNVAAPGAVTMQALLEAAGTPFTWRAAPRTARKRVVLDVARMMQHAPLPDTASDAGYLVAAARAVGALP